MVATKTHAVEKQKALHIINNFLHHFKNSVHQKDQPTIGAYKAILSPEFQNSSAGKVIGKNIEDFLKRIEQTKEKYSHIDFDHLNECLISGNKAVIHYDMKRTLQNGKKSPLNIMAIVTIEDDLITQWSQVSHEK